MVRSPTVQRSPWRDPVLANVTSVRLGVEEVGRTEVVVASIRLDRSAGIDINPECRLASRRDRPGEP
jgi:hypothetical protein